MTAMNTGTLIGGLASVSIVFLWLATFHKKCFISILKTHKVIPYGIYIGFGEAITSHFWFLVKGLIQRPKREALEEEVKDLFLEQLGQTKRNVLVTHSCRSIFYYLIKNILEKVRAEKGQNHIKIAISTVHFGSFYRLLVGMQKSLGCSIQFYEIDLKKDDWTLDENSINEEEFSKCDMVMCQHLFGVPFTQNKFWVLGKKYNIPIVEDCVQSGSLFGKYKGHQQSDVVLYSGGLDKTPACFGAGFGYFRDSAHGKSLYKSCKAIHDECPLDTWKARFISCANQLIHLMIAKNIMWLDCFLGVLAYVLVSDPGNYIKWYVLGLQIRKNKKISAFQHAESGFLRKPSVYHLMSMRYGLSKGSKYYEGIAKNEIRLRDILLANIPTKYHRVLFPWWTPEVLQAHRDNQGISEFSWVYCPVSGERENLQEFASDRFLILIINTTWEFHESTKLPVGKDINQNIAYLPNMNELDDVQVAYVGQVMTEYCESLKTTPTKSKSC
jgi:hypothetical protein